jgi:hypothetical protein
MDASNRDASNMQEGLHLQTTAVLASKEKITIATATMQVTAEMFGKAEMLAKAGTSTALRNWQQQGQEQRQRQWKMLHAIATQKQQVCKNQQGQKQNMHKKIV